MHTDWKRIQRGGINIGDVVFDKRLKARQLFAVSVIKLAKPNFFNS